MLNFLKTKKSKNELSSGAEKLFVTNNNVTPLIIGEGGTWQISIPVTIHDHKSVTMFDAKALIDSRATGLYINSKAVKKYHIEVFPLEKEVKVLNADGTENSQGKLTDYVRL